MLRIDRISVWIFIIFFALLIPSLVFVKFLDELFVYSFLGLAAADIVVNGQWRRYRLLYILLGVMAFYVLYSVTAVHYNTSKAVVLGAILELKPFIPLAAYLSICPEVTAGEKRIIRGVALFNAIVCLICSFALNYTVFIFGHIAFFGTICLLSGLAYLYSSIAADGLFSRRNLIFAMLMLVLGLACTRSKYYGEFVLSLFFLFVYKPGMLRRLTPSRLFILISLMVLVIAVAYQKISFYFLDAIDFSHIDLNKMDSYARMALYAMMFVVIGMHPLFGSGLASYASFASASPYSSLYAELGIDKVYGLTEKEPDFISDAYYPELAQFGIIGIILFIWFWMYIYRYLKVLVRARAEKYHSLFRIGAIIFCFIFIEMTSGTMVFQGPGEAMMMLLGLICSAGALLRKNHEENIENAPIVTNLPNRIR